MEQNNSQWSVSIEHDYWTRTFTMVQFTFWSLKIMIMMTAIVIAKKFFLSNGTFFWNCHQNTLLGPMNIEKMSKTFCDKNIKIKKHKKHKLQLFYNYQQKQQVKTISMNLKSKPQTLEWSKDEKSSGRWWNSKNFCAVFICSVSCQKKSSVSKPTLLVIVNVLVLCIWKFQGN